MRRSSGVSGKTGIQVRGGRPGARPIESILSRQPWDSLAELLPPTAPPDSIDSLRRYAGLLLEWNRNVSNLISKNDEERIVARHLRESLAPARWLSECDSKRWLDFGSGAGLPAIPLAIAGVGSDWTLVESRRNKTLFLRKAVSEMNLNNVSVVLGRLEMLLAAGQLQSSFDGFTSRATLALAPTLQIAAQAVVAGGKAFLWKGSRREEEMRTAQEWRAVWAHEGEMKLEEAGASVVMFNRVNG